MDVYSLGIVIYWLVAGEGPYVGLPPYQVRCTLRAGPAVAALFRAWDARGRR